MKCLMNLRFFLAFWYQDVDGYVLCGNATGSRRCPNGYVCLKDQGIK
jgi:hypothetical protein